ncbi:MAG: hypothetical protein IPF98_08015 [Gemmatimonadetes bacterium]|nr:hypothetical protein [Gemmatimonadota bacterium]MCC6769795.1 hypothetical protein [Gemmatimonadaceae bacterium]
MNALDLFQDSTPAPEPSSAARRLLFRDAAGNESAAEVVRWWERRRLPFNVAVGATGLVSLTSIAVLSAVGPFPHHVFGPPLVGVLAYGVIANVAYTSGWMLELLVLRPIFGHRTGTVGATLFRYGLAFSVGISAIPIGISAVDFGIRIVRWALGLGGA